MDATVLNEFRVNDELMSETEESSGTLTSTVVETALPFGAVPVRWVQHEFQGASDSDMFMGAPPLTLEAVDDDLHLVARGGAMAPAAANGWDMDMGVPAMPAGPPNGEGPCRMVDIAVGVDDGTPQLRFPLMDGQSWHGTVAVPGGTLEQRMKVVGLETVETSAGSFEAVRLASTNAGDLDWTDAPGVDQAAMDGAPDFDVRVEMEMSYWYAPAVGQVVRTESTAVSMLTGEVSGESMEVRTVMDIVMDLQAHAVDADPGLGLGAIGVLVAEDDAAGAPEGPLRGKGDDLEYNLRENETLDLVVDDFVGGTLPDGLRLDDVERIGWTIRDPAGNSRETTGRSMSPTIGLGGIHEVAVTVFGAPAAVNPDCAENIHGVPVFQAEAEIYAYWEGDLQVAHETGSDAGTTSLARVPLAPGAVVAADHRPQHTVPVGPGDQVALQVRLGDEVRQVEDQLTWDGGPGSAHLDWDAEGPGGAPVLLGHEASIHVRVDY